MAQLQYQEQEDLMADFDAPVRKEENRYSRRKSRNIVRSKDEVRKPTMKENFFKQTQAPRIPKSTPNAADCTTKTTAESRTMHGGYMGFDLCDLIPESFTALFEEVQNFFTSNFGSLDTVDVIREGSVAVFDKMKEALHEVPKYEEELKYLTSAVLIFYGGSWTILAGILAAVEAFGTKEVVQEAFKLGTIILDDNVDEIRDVAPTELKDNFRKLGLQVALLIAVVISPSWAELCITVAFASKYTCLVPVQDILKATLSTPNSDGGELDGFLGLVDDGWFDLLAVIACNILSLILFGCFPRLITAMYMGYLGISMLMETLMDQSDISVSIWFELEMFDRSFWMENRTQYYAWGFVAVMAIWQTISGYTGVCLFFSWLMFLQPVVHVYNQLTVDSVCEETKNMKHE